MDRASKTAGKEPTERVASGRGSKGTLYVVGTPIGNLQDLSPRARDVLGRVDAIAAEDTRRTRGLLSNIGLEAPLIAHHEHNEEQRSADIVERLLHGESIALVSDAGMPLISDPGWRLVRRALLSGVAVHAVPGPSAVTAALAVSGLPTDRFVFEGFLPRRAGARAARLEQLASERRTIVLFEAVHRVADTVAAMLAAFGPQREVCVARELTKLHEQVFHGSLSELAAALGKSVALLGEFVMVVAGNSIETPIDDAEVLRIFAVLRRELPPGKAAALTAELTGLQRNDVYRLTQAEA